MTISDELIAVNSAVLGSGFSRRRVHRSISVLHYNVNLACLCLHKPTAVLMPGLTLNAVTCAALLAPAATVDR